MKEIIIGDLHGDWKTWNSILKHAKCIDQNNKWIGKNIRLIQMGDIFDRGGRGIDFEDGDEEWMILSDLLDYIHIATNFDSEVHFLIGNHEWMNAQGFFNYVSPKSLESSLYQYRLWCKKFPFLFDEKIKTNEDARLKIMKIGGPLSKILTHFGKFILKIENKLYVHGGLLPIHGNITNDIDLINEVGKKLFLGISLTSDVEQNISQDYFLNFHAIWYNRQMAFQQLSINDVLKICYDFQINKIFLGHTPQFKDGMKKCYHDHVYLCDSGKYSAYGKKKGDIIQYAIWNTEYEKDWEVISFKDF